MKVENIDYNFAANKCLMRNQKLLYNKKGQQIQLRCNSKFVINYQFLKVSEY